MNFRIRLLIALAAILTACPAPAATPATLTVAITGNPSATTPSVTVTGPNGYSQTISATTTLTNLEPGAYTTTASAFESANLEYAATISGSPATVAAGGTLSVTVTYAKSATLVSSLADSGAGSLRDAIAAAPAGETLKFSKATTGTIALSSELGIGKNLTLAGVGVTLSGGNASRVLNIASGANVTVQGLKLTGGKSIAVTSSGVRPQGLSDGQGGVIYNAGTLLLKDAEVSGGEAALGGGVYNASGAALTLLSGTIKASKAVGDVSNTGAGGGVFVEADATFTITGGSIEANTASRNAGGVYLRGGTLTMSGGSIKDNTAAFSGVGVMMVSSDNKISRFTLSGGTISGNSNTAAPVAPNNTGGGGLLNIDGEFTMTGGTISGNKNMFGGGVNIFRSVDTATPIFNFSGGEIKNNIALGEGLGGGVTNGGTMTMTGGTISGNTSANGGGGINSYRVLNLSGGTLTGNAAKTGGGISLTRDVNLSGTVSISSNTATDGGGGIRVYSTGRLKLSGGAVSGNSSKFAAGVQYDGPFNGDSGSVVTLDGATIQGNTATEGGGGLAGGGKLTFLAGSVRQNTAKSGAGVDLYPKGIFNMTGGVVQANTSIEDGGGVSVNLDSTFTFENGVIENNTARSGGGIKLYRGTVSIKGGTVRGNTTTQFCGGAISMGGDATAKGVLNFSGGSVENNTVADVGGGICVYQYGSMVMSGGSVKNNSAPQSGGGISVGANGTLILENGVIENNTAALFGGGVQLSNGIFTMTGGTIRANTVTVESGGGVNLFDASTFTMTGGVIESNKATAVGRNGGGIHVAGLLPIVTIKDGTIRNNQAENIGGGIAVSEAKVIVEGGTVSGNTAKNGGGVSIDGNSSSKGSFSMSGGTITANTVTISGGGIFSTVNGVLTRTGGTVSSNTPQDIFPTP